MTRFDTSDKIMISVSTLCLALCFTFIAIAPERSNKPVNVPYFKQGQVLYPDYVCPDTLVVFDAEGLNKGMALIEQGFIDASDYEIDSLLHTYCEIKP